MEHSESVLSSLEGRGGAPERSRDRESAPAPPSPSFVSPLHRRPIMLPPKISYNTSSIAFSPNSSNGGRNNSTLPTLTSSPLPLPPSPPNQRVSEAVGRPLSAPLKTPNGPPVMLSSDSFSLSSSKSTDSTPVDIPCGPNSPSLPFVRPSPLRSPKLFGALSRPLSASAALPASTSGDPANQGPLIESIQAPMVVPKSPMNEGGRSEVNKVRPNEIVLQPPSTASFVYTGIGARKSALLPSHFKPSTSFQQSVDPVESTWTPPQRAAGDASQLAPIRAELSPPSLAERDDIAPLCDRDNYGNTLGTQEKLVDTARCHLIAQDVFALSLPRNQLAQHFEALSRFGAFEPKQRQFLVPLARHQTVVQWAQTTQVALQPLPALVMRCAAHSTRLSPQEGVAALARLPQAMRESLLAHQRSAVVFAGAHGGRVLLGDEMGLGKTFSGVAIAAAYRNEWPVVVLVPSALRATWADVFARLLPELSGDDILVVADTKKPLQLRPVTIISYSMATKLATTLLAAHVKVVLCDESHSIKNYNAQRTKALTPLLKRASRCVLLSGTPALSRPVELYPQVNALLPAVFTRFDEFTNRYCDAHRDRFNRLQTQGSCNLNELQVVLSMTCLLRRYKDVLVDELPPKERQKVTLTIDERAVDMIGVVHKEMASLKKEKNARNHDFEKTRLMNELYRATGRAKLSAVLSYLRGSVWNEGAEVPKCVIFAVQRDVIDALVVELHAHNIPHIRICGLTPPATRAGLVEHFQTDSECRVAVLSILAAGVGLTLTAAHTVIFAELYWNPGHLLQAEDRCHRIGQTKTVNVLYLVAPNTLDEALWSLLERKLRVLSRALDTLAHDTSDSLAAQNTAATEEMMDNEASNSVAELLMEKVLNYEKRRARMQRRREIRACGLKEGDEGSLKELASLSDSDGEHGDFQALKEGEENENKVEDDDEEVNEGKLDAGGRKRRQDDAVRNMEHEEDERPSKRARVEEVYDRRDMEGAVEKKRKEEEKREAEKGTPSEAKLTLTSREKLRRMRWKAE